MIITFCLQHWSKRSYPDHLHPDVFDECPFPSKKGNKYMIFSPFLLFLIIWTFSSLGICMNQQYSAKPHRQTKVVISFSLWNYETILRKCNKLHECCLSIFVKKSAVFLISQLIWCRIVNLHTIAKRKNHWFFFFLYSFEKWFHLH